MPGNNQYPFYIYDQYVKDISFENPNYLIKYSENTKKPEVKVNIETSTAKISDDNYEVQMHIVVRSTIDQDDIFVLEIVYAALVSVAPGLSQDLLEPILVVHCPFLMFPFMREIVADITRAGGYPPLLVEPIDFAGMYLDKKKPESQAGGINDPIEATA
jgi:preprotein translocase subunit SecB